MKRLFITLTCICVLWLPSTIAQSQTDSVKIKTGLFKRFYNYLTESNEDKTIQKKFDFSIIGGPHYSSDTKFGIGLVAAGLFRSDQNDSITPPSNVALSADISTTGFYMFGITGNTLLKKAKYRIDYNAFFFSMPSDFWGIGYDNGRYGRKDAYKRLQTEIHIKLMRLVTRNTYIGLNIGFNYTLGKDFKHSYYLSDESLRYVCPDIGFFLIYDSRDIITDPKRGFYFNISQRFFPAALGNHSSFSRTEFSADLYHRIWKGGTLTYDLHGEFNYNKVPWTMLARIGGSYRMRGYYEGRYRDRNIIEFQTELRQKIYRRNGIVLWIGAGNVFPQFDAISATHILPNAGIGYRWEFKKRVNIRLDYGIGLDNMSGFIFNINEAF